MNALTGTPALIRLALRRDRFTLPAWILGLAGFTAGTTAMSAHGFPTRADLVQATTIMATNPGMRLLGLASGASVGGYAMIRDFLSLAVLAALMSTFAVVRHTRQSEESGRGDLLGAAVVGRQAPLAAALAVAVAANVALAGAVGLAMILTGQPAAGSFTAGAAVAAVGVSFAGVTAVTTQLASSTRGASGLSAAILGAAFLASGIGNMVGQPDQAGVRVDSAWPVWLSPIGWGQQMRPFGGDHWWPLGLAVGCLLAGAATGAYLVSRRDFGRGVLAQRPGPEGADRALRTPIGLPWRLQRAALVAWGAGMLGFGMVLGGISSQVTDLTGAGRDWYLRVGGTDQILDAFRVSMMQMAGIGAAIYAVQVLLRMRAEEADGPAEPILATAVSRTTWALGHAVTALIGAVVLVLLFATGMAVVAGMALGDPAAELRVLLGAAVVQLPAVLVLAAAVVAAVGLVPRLAGVLSWALLVAAILLGPVFGSTLGLPGWAQDLSPFTHTPKAPALPVTATPMLALGALVVVLTVTGLLALRRRDLALPA
jgi:ABC-2 type transport system permease protein